LVWASATPARAQGFGVTIGRGGVTIGNGGYGYGTYPGYGYGYAPGTYTYGRGYSGYAAPYVAPGYVATPAYRYAPVYTTPTYVYPNRGYRVLAPRRFRRW
jgi:hypothetical protein